MIDLHCHLLPGVDDGSRSVEQSVGVLREMGRLGVTDVCLTPHVRSSETSRGPNPRHEDAFRALSAKAPASPRLHRGAEVMLDRPLAGDTEATRPFSLGGTRYILVEFPRMVALDTVNNALSRIAETGWVSVLAHPERYTCCSPDAVALWRELGARMQVDATTLLSPQARGHRARELVSLGLADIMAADNHGDKRTIAAGIGFLVEQDGEEQAQLLAVQNPGAILRDEPLVPVPPIKLKQSLMQKIRQLLEGDE
ncbi:MAG TPA: CpsB/CapC family capsule biosynthesis tyrosine phosphatase [Gemmatimonadales bacterium]|nr:CpsB/CapC family capsule biosynthesis tyrosine phosphatase [Gemmatimonadales bacterium]